MTRDTEQQLKTCPNCKVHADMYEGVYQDYKRLAEALEDIETAVIKNPERLGSTAQVTLDHIRATARGALNE